MDDEEKWAINEYEKLMNESIQEYPTGCTEDFLKDVDKILLSKIVAAICKRNPNEDAYTEILKNFNKNRKIIFDEFIYKNKLLLAKKAERIRQKKIAEKEQLKQAHQEFVQFVKVEEKNVSDNKESYEAEIVADDVTGIQENSDQKTIDYELEVFKDDVQKRIDTRIKGWNTDTTFLTTNNKFYCCIFYNQGVTATDVVLYFRQEGSMQLQKLRERYFYAYKAHRLEEILKEMLKHSTDIEETWKQAVNDCQ